MLCQLLDSWKAAGRRCIDIGAGYGRFTDLFKRYYSEVVLLEAAEKIYSVLQDIHQSKIGVICTNSDFESFSDDNKYDLVFISGVLYLYDDCLLENFVKKAASLLDKNGLLVIRDFISTPNRKMIRSSYVEDGICYYRPPQFWGDLANRIGVTLLEIRRSKPSLPWLRNNYILTLMAKLKLTRLYGSQVLIDAIMRFGSLQLSHSGIQTGFIGMRRL